MQEQIMIEHRHTKRVALVEKISIYHRGILVADCKIKDISVDGMSLWAGPLQYHRNTMLEVEINAPNSDSQARLRIPAIVVYSAAKALGLMFTQVSEVAQQSLRQMMNKAGDLDPNQDKAAQSWGKAISSQPV
jgi:hypothetical protein